MELIMNSLLLEMQGLMEKLIYPMFLQIITIVTPVVNLQVLLGPKWEKILKKRLYRGSTKKKGRF
tara:strand:+ start:829 stop:1023 length:195 start_codon:yes stop_codon:yes gene_type:complete